jgi:ribonuclease BN (tRNA processing enzyme)
MRLTVLGKSPSWQDAGGACSGYLVEDGDTRVLVDCGNGVFGKLRERMDYVDVDAVVISHLHADHFLDLVPYSYALTYAPRQQPVPVHTWPGTDHPARPVLHVPPGARDTFRQVVGAWGNDDLIENAFDLREYDPDAQLDIGPLRIRFQRVPHFTETFAMSISSTGGAGQIIYGADCRPTDDLARFAKGATLMLVEATLPRPERDGQRGHLTSAEAGEHASAAGAGRLVLVHISDELDPEWARSQAAGSFSGPVEVAREGAVFEV